MDASVTEKVIALAKRRGFYWQAYEIYGGVGGFYTLGPLGIRLKDNIIRVWRKIFLEPYEFIEIESPTIAPYIVFEASGHVGSFKDAMAECLKCGNKYRADHLLEEKGVKVSEATSLDELEKLLNEKGVVCPDCNSVSWKVSSFLTMFQTNIGPYKENIGFLRPETAQGMFVEFKQLYEINRARMPFGVAQIGKAYRNEISPRQGLIRLREFSQMELELFFDPLNNKCPYLDDVKDIRMNILDEEKVRVDDNVPHNVNAKEAVERGFVKEEWLAFMMALSQKFLCTLGIKPEFQRFKAKLEGERAHYSAQTFDHEVLTGKFGWVEVAGHAYRQDYDLKSHSIKSKSSMEVVEELAKPIKVRKKLAYLDPLKVKRNFGEKSSEIFKLISTMKPFELAELLEKDGKIKVNNIVIDKEYFIFKEVEETISTRKYIPHVIEPSFGIERIIHAILEHSYHEKEDRVILSLNEEIAPYKYAVFPLVKKDGLDVKAKEIYSMLKLKGFTVIYDDDGSIGRRYARADEIGVCKAVTVDYQTLEDNTITVRDRDSWQQKRISINTLLSNNTL
ncbi:MAG: glycine--tRNA ligase [Nitrososphaeria archaeon]